MKSVIPLVRAVSQVRRVERHHEVLIAVGAVQSRVGDVIRRHDRRHTGDQERNRRVTACRVVVKDLDVLGCEGLFIKIDDRRGSMGRSNVTSKAVGIEATPLIASDQLSKIPPLGPMPPATSSVQLPTARRPSSAESGLTGLNVPL